MTIFLSYIFYFIVASASPLQRRWLAKTKNAENTGQIHFAFQMSLVIVFLTLFIPFFEPLYFSGNPYYLILLSLVCGVFGAGVYITSFIAQKHVEAGVSSLVMNIYTPITIILSTILLHEGLTILQGAGTVLLLVGMIVVSKKHHIGRFRFDKYFLLLLSSGTLLAVLLVAERALVKMTGFSGSIFLSWWSTCLFLGLATLITRNKSEYSKKDIAITGTLKFLQNLSWVLLVYLVGNLSLVSAITTFKVVLMFVAGALLLNEKQDLPRKIIGSLIALAGLLLMK